MDAYKSAISLIKDIASKEELTKKVYLIPTNSIPKFIAILTDFNALNPNTKLTEDKKIEIEKAFFKYNLEKNIEIISEYEKLQDIINDEEDNEFIIVDIKFLTGMEIEEYYEKTVYLNKTEGNIQIKFENTENNYYLEQKDNGLFELIKNDNYTNDLSEIVSFFDCFTRIKKLTGYLNDNYNSFFSDDSCKPYSLFFCSFIATKNLEENIRDSFEEIQLKEPLPLIDTFYDKMHEELNQKEKKTEVKSYESDKILEDLIIQFREDFESNNKSIISDHFYFEKITTMSCCNCHKNINRIEIMNKLVINLEEVRKYKSQNIKCFTSLNIYDCLKYFVHQNINKLECNKCHNKNCESLCKINSPPEILTIILHYNENFGDDILFNIYPEENSDDLNINLDFSIFKFENNYVNENINANYSLIGFCSYYNNDEGKYCRPFYLNEDKEWILHRPNETIETNLKERDLGNPYILFYKKI